MATETEIKLRVDDVERTRGRLAAAGGKLLIERHFEDNLLLDDAAGTLRCGNQLLRLRTTSDGALVTFKGTPEPASAFKEREEIETGVGDLEALLLVFERLGFKVWTRYQKFREEYELPIPGLPVVRVHVTLDETPIGPFIEIEGSGEGIRAAASLLGFKESEYIRESYYSLYVEHCRRSGLEPGQMVFGTQRQDS